MPKLKIAELFVFAKKVFYIWAGLGMIIFGIAGLVLPIIPGIIPIAIGITLLAKGSERFNDHKHIQKLFHHGRTVREELGDRKKILKWIKSLF